MEIKRDLSRIAQSVLLAAAVASPSLTYKDVAAQTIKAQSPKGYATLPVIVPPSATPSPTPEASVAPQQVKILPDLLPKFIDAEAKMADPTDPFAKGGDRLTQPWELVGENEVHVTFQRMDLVMNLETNQIRVGTLLDLFHEKGLDQDLANGKLGVLVPEQTDINDGASNLKESVSVRENRLNISSTFKNFINQQQLENLGAPTSPVRDFGPFEILRFQDTAVQFWKDSGTFEYVLIGDAAAKAGIIPKEALLPNPSQDLEILKLIQTEPTDINQIIEWTASQMGISMGYAKKIISCESGYNPRAVNPQTGASGLWQIMPEHADIFTALGWNYWTDRFDPYKNSVVATKVKKSEGLGAWSCR